ncbi:aminoglycoside phosphotransferase [Micrococcus lylae]|uniref:Aminoglycoside phosphotransferase n=1 Tax=Micrococcus lylae TaxID=1273 RepID=A0A1R4ITW7_9MICC|nr:phosphotransferase [Micrococcus lylae]SJN23317.1 aminoglycoside phosphotransferase [Micrococcus lylae]
MNRQPMHLAALAAAAVPGLSPTGVLASPDDPADFSSAIVLAERGERWRVRSPHTPEAAMRLETELQVLAGFTPAVRANLPFRTPSVAGAVRLDGLRTFVYQDMPGAVHPLEDLVDAGEAAVADVARVMAAIHTLPDQVVALADLPVYTPEQVRTRRLNELDQAATTGRIPATLLRRWETALEEKELWSFEPVPVHGDLHEENLLLERGRVVGVTGWTDLHVGDPAVDFAWLAAVEDPDFADRVLEAYRARRGAAGAADDGDEHLMRRAALVAEFALAQWLVRGVDRHDTAMVAEAEEMLGELEDGIRAAEEAERAAEQARRAEAERAAKQARRAEAERAELGAPASGVDDEAETGVLPAVPPSGTPRTGGSHRA